LTKRIEKKEIKHKKERQKRNMEKPRPMDEFLGGRGNAPKKDAGEKKKKVANVPAGPMQVGGEKF